MTYGSLQEKIAKHTGVSIGDIDKVLKSLTNEVKIATKNEEEITLPSFGKFSQAVSNPRPLIGKPGVMTKRTIRTKFTVSKKFKEDLNA